MTKISEIAWMLCPDPNERILVIRFTMVRSPCWRKVNNSLCSLSALIGILSSLSPPCLLCNLCIKAFYEVGLFLQWPSGLWIFEWVVYHFSLGDHRDFERSKHLFIARSAAAPCHCEERSSEAIQKPNKTVMCEYPVVYIMANKRNGTLYTGVTSNIVQRVYQHKQAVIPGFTDRYGCKLLVYYGVVA